MPKKPSKRKNTKSKSKGKGAKRLSWWKIFFALIIFMAGTIYFLSQYDGWYLLKDLYKDYLPKREMEVKLYFADPNSDYLMAERRKIPRAFTQKQRITKTIEELITGPKGTLIRTLPLHTTLKNVHIDNDRVVWLDFSDHLSRDHPGGSSAEIITVYSIVNTVLLNFTEETKVRILIDSLEIETLAGHIDCSKPFVANKEFAR